jgi:hypothetical protein
MLELEWIQSAENFSVGWLFKVEHPQLTGQGNLKLCPHKIRAVKLSSVESKKPVLQVASRIDRERFVLIEI